MPRYEVILFPNRRSVTAESAEHAYEWLDQHANPGEMFTINSVNDDGGVTIVDHGSWTPNPLRKRR